MRLQPEPFHMLQEFGHRNKHRGVNPVHGKEAPPFQKSESNYFFRELPCLQTSLQLNRRGL